ncbi:MAG: DUF2624 family protein [Sporolactobacillus sp.]
MNPFLQQLINQRLNQVTATELYDQARQMSIPLNQDQADRLAEHIHGRHLDLFREEDQAQLLALLTDELGEQTANDLFMQFKKVVDKFK